MRRARLMITYGALAYGLAQLFRSREAASNGLGRALTPTELRQAGAL